MSLLVKGDSSNSYKAGLFFYSTLSGTGKTENELQDVEDQDVDDQDAP